MVYCIPYKGAVMCKLEDIFGLWVKYIELPEVMSIADVM